MVVVQIFTWVAGTGRLWLLLGFLVCYQLGHALTTLWDGIGILDALSEPGPARLNLCCFELRNLSNNMFYGSDLEYLIMEDVLVRKQAASTLYFAGALML
jgi:hypothetical protein